jgi:hypothetical protein
VCLYVCDHRNPERGPTFHLGTHRIHDDDADGSKENKLHDGIVICGVTVHINGTACALFENSLLKFRSN